MQKIIITLFIIVFLAACGSPTINAPAFDPNLESAYMRMTEVAAGNSAEVLSLIATSSAQARIIPITETAAQQSVDWTQAAFDQTATAAQWTPTPSPVPTITMTATPDATQTSVFDDLNNKLLESKRANERADNMNKFYGMLPGIIFALLAGGLILGYMIFIRRERLKPAEVDEQGRIKPIIDHYAGTITQPSMMPNYRGHTREGVAEILLMLLLQKLQMESELPKITAARQDVVISKQQDIEIARARLPRRLVDSMRDVPLLESRIDPGAARSSFLLPSWDIINGWDSKDGLPYYTAKGLEVFDNERFPHLSVLGATGMGKSRRFLRPLIACALAAGHRVIIVGKATDYQPFVGHKNATLLKINKITEPGQAHRYAQILEAIVQEMNHRDDILTARGESTWTRAGFYRTIIVLDEFGNALRLMDKPTAAQSRIFAEGLVMEGRKAGFNIWLSNQRATGMASIFSQTGKAIFRVEPDEERAHKSLQGASGLLDGYYLARFGAQKLAGGFEPSDSELVQFLASRPVMQLEPDQWIDAITTPADAALPGNDRARIVAPMQETKATLLQGLDDNELKIIELHQAGGYDASDIAQAVYNDVAATAKVVEIVRRWKVAKMGVDEFTKETLAKMRAADSVSLSEAQRVVYGADDPRGGKHFQAVQQIWRQMQESATGSDTKSESTPIQPISLGSTSNSVTDSEAVA